MCQARPFMVVACCLHTPASLGCIAPRRLRHSACLPGLLWAWRGCPGTGLSGERGPQREPLRSRRRSALTCPQCDTSGVPGELALPSPAVPRLLTRRGAPKGGTRDCLYEPCGFFVFLPVEVSNCRDCSIYSPSSFALKKNLLPTLKVFCISESRTAVTIR